MQTTYSEVLRYVNELVFDNMYNYVCLDSFKETLKNIKIKEFKDSLAYHGYTGKLVVKDSKLYYRHIEI